MFSKSFTQSQTLSSSCSVRRIEPEWDWPDHDNAMKWRNTWNHQPWRVRLLWLALWLIIGGGGTWWFQRSKSGTGNVAIHQSDLRGSPVNPQDKAGHDMAVYNIGSIDQVVIGARPEAIERVRQLATASIFKPVSENQNRLKIADEMDGLLRASGFEVNVLVSQLFSPSREPIQAIFRPEDRQLVEAVLVAFKPMLQARCSRSAGSTRRRNRSLDHGGTKVHP